MTDAASLRHSDAATLRAVADGDEAAFARLYRAHREQVFRVAYGILLDRDEARDVVQETFLKLHAVSERWRPDARVSTWLYRVAVNQSLSLRRRLGSAAREILLSPSRTPERDVSASQGAAIARATLRALPAQQRAVVTLHLDAGLAPAEIAETLGTNANAVRVNLHRGLEKLRQALRTAGIAHVDEEDHHA